MGVIARALTVVGETRNDPGWLTRDDDADMGIQTPSGVRVSRSSALGMTTVWRCVDLLSSAIAQSPKDVIVKVGGQSFPEFNPPSWLSDPHPGDPNYTASDYFSEIAISLLLDGNYFVSVFPHIFNPQTLTVLDPQLVKVNSATSFTVKDRSGVEIGDFSPLTMLHGWWMKLPGSSRGISPLESLRRSIGGAIAAEQFAASYFGQGTTLAFGVEIAGDVKKEQKDEFRAALKSDLAGLKKAHGVGVLTGGARFVTGLAPSPEQAQMLATRQFSVEDLCRPFGVPPHMAGSQQPGAVSYASVEGTLLEFKQYAVLPLALRIEAGHNRLVTVPDNITSAGASAQFKFNLDGIARADLLTRYQAYSAGIMGGFLTPDEARVDEDLAPKGGKAGELFMQSQMQPISTVALNQHIASGLMTLDEGRQELGLAPMAWAEGPSAAEIASLVEQVKSGLMTLDEARKAINLPPLEWADGPSADEVATLEAQVKSGLMTLDEARAILNRPPLQWAEGPSVDEVAALAEQVKSGLMTLDEARATLGRPALEWADGPTPEEIASLLDQVKGGLRTHDEARKEIGLPPMQWDAEPTTEEMIEQLKAGILTNDEAREIMKRPPIAWAEGPTLEEIQALTAQINAGLLTNDEARAKLGLPPIVWPEDLNEKVQHVQILIDAGFEPASVLTTLGLPPMKHLGLPPVKVQKFADAEGGPETPLSPEVPSKTGSVVDAADKTPLPADPMADPMDPMEGTE